MRGRSGEGASFVFLLLFSLLLQKKKVCSKCKMMSLKKNEVLSDRKKYKVIILGE